jgi:hypothetical protein
MEVADSEEYSSLSDTELSTTIKKYPTAPGFNQTKTIWRRMAFLS